MSNLLFLVEKEGHEAASSPQLLWRSGFAELLHLLCESKPWNRDVEVALTLPTDEALEFFRRLYAPYEGSYDLWIVDDDA